MVMTAFGGDAEVLNKEYRGFRQQAKRTAWSIDEFGDIEISKYNLGTIDFDQDENPRYFQIDTRPIQGEVEKSYNLAELDTR